MHARCENPNTVNYGRYGAKGIRVCEEWKEFKPFYDWCVHHDWKRGLQIDRIDSKDDYRPDNCRIVTPFENNMNRSNTLRFTYNNETLTLLEWSEKVGISYKTLWQRIKVLNWSIDKALSYKRG